MKTLLSLISLASLTLLLSSCAKSLTDLGYRGGSIYTLSASGVGMQSNQPRIIIFDDIQPRNGGYQTGFYTATGTNPNMRSANQALISSVSTKERLKFLRKFYSALLAENFNAKKFSKKYRKLCNDDMLAMLDNHSEDGANGWSVFKPKNSSTNAPIVIQCFDTDVFSVASQNNPTQCLLIEVAMPDLTKEPIICNIQTYVL